MIFLLIFGYLLSGLFIIFSSFYFLFLFNSILMVGHDRPTSKKAIKEIIKIIAKRKSGKKVFYDLGCGRGHVLIAVKKVFPKFSVIGVEKRRLQIFFGKINTFFHGQNVVFQRGDLFETDLKDADIVYIYLWDDMMPPLEKKLRKELKKGTFIITNTSSLPNWEPIEARIVHSKKPNFEKLFVYTRQHNLIVLLAPVPLHRLGAGHTKIILLSKVTF